MSGAPTIQSLLAGGTERLETLSESPRLDSELLLAQALECPRTFLYAWPDTLATQAQAQEFKDLLSRRERGEPVSYITGWREFWSLDLQVTPEVLVPRAETEQLVELALELITPDYPVRIADIGTGSGAIAVAIASERPKASVVGIDTRADTLDVARANAARLDLENIQFVEGHLVEPLATDMLNMIVSNPPYVADDDPALDADGVRFEPRIALCGGPDGLDIIRELVPSATQLLAPGGSMLLEHGADQGVAVRDCMESAGLHDVRTHQDLAGLDRITTGCALAQTH
jgi:release factor glutamine methyltransferase